MIPLSAVLSLIERQESFNTQLIDKLGLYLVQAAEKYERALNPPIPEDSGREMSYSAFTDESDDLQYQIDAGIIPTGDITPSMLRILKDTETVIET